MTRVLGPLLSFAALSATSLLLAHVLLRAGMSDALILVDVQRCFLPGGSLPVERGREIVPIINRIRLAHGQHFKTVCLSKDWHCPDHVSFANIHPGHKPFDVITLTYNSKNELCKTDESGTCPDAVDCRAELAWNETRQLQQTLWPAHCIINDPESELDDSLLTKEDDHFVLKGSRCSVDSYSAFFDNARFESTGLHDHLRGRGITRVFVAGLALDYCVKYTALDAKSLGYDVYVVVDATRGTSPSSAERAIEELKNSGVRLINSSEIEKCFKKKKNGSVVAVTLLLVAAALLVRRAKKRTQ